MRPGGTRSKCSATTGLHAFRNLPTRNDDTVQYHRNLQRAFVVDDMRSGQYQRLRGSTWPLTAPPAPSLRASSENPFFRCIQQLHAATPQVISHLAGTAAGDNSRDTIQGSNSRFFLQISQNSIASRLMWSCH